MINIPSWVIFYLVPVVHPLLDQPYHRQDAEEDGHHHQDHHDDGHPPHGLSLQNKVEDVDDDVLTLPGEDGGDRAGSLSALILLLLH